MFRKLVIIPVLLFVCACHHPPIIGETFAAPPQPVKSKSIKPMMIKLPDLSIRGYQFVPSNDKALRIQVANYGQLANRPCRIQLTVRKINGAPVGRKTYQTIPRIQPGGSAWILLYTTNILPKNVSLKDTTFKLIADATKNVPESNEKNNETWHNLK